MKLDDDAQDAVTNLGNAINSAVGESKPVGEAIEWLRALGYEPHLTLKLEIALEKTEDENDEAGDDDEYETSENSIEEPTFELTDDDLRTLQRMKIRF